VSLDGFVDQYIRLVQEEIKKNSEILETKDFKKKSDFTRVQGKLQGLKESLSLLRSVPEED